MSTKIIPQDMSSGLTLTVQYPAYEVLDGYHAEFLRATHPASVRNPDRPPSEDNLRFWWRHYCVMPAHALIREQPGITYEGLADAMGVSVAMVSRIVADLSRSGFVRLERQLEPQRVPEMVMDLTGGWVPKK